MRQRAFRLAPLMAVLLLLAAPVLAVAQDQGASATPLAEQIGSLTTAIDTIWVAVAASFVLLMQAGFGLLEAGLSRMKNAGAVMAKILINMSIVMIMFWATGFALAFGEGNSFWGTTGFFFGADGAPTSTGYVYDGLTASITSLWFFQVVFCAVSLAIVFGSMLDRTKFIGYAIFGVAYAGFIYPIVAHWTWGGGWLAERGFLDYAGSSIVHLQGALGALAGALILGPRIGKFRNGKPVPIPGHSIPLAITGVIVLWFGWMGFNGGSSLLAAGADFADVIVSTNLAAGAGVIGATVMSLIMFRTIDVSQMGNGAIGGLVAITAACAFVDYWAGIVIGLVAGMLIPVIVVAVERMKIDDPLGALAAHGVSGIWGTLAIGLFGTAARMDPIIVDTEGLASREGLLYGGGLSQLWVQFYGIAATVAFTFVLTAAVFMLIRVTVGLRVDEEHEMSGLDISEHGMFGYPEQFIEVPGAMPETARAGGDGSSPHEPGTVTRPATAS